MCFVAIGTALGATAANAAAVGVAATSAAVGVGSSAAQYAGQRKQAKQQQRYQGQAAAAERQRAIQEQSALRMREAQEMEALHTEKFRVGIKGEETSSTAGVAADAAGVSGASVDHLLDNYTREVADYRFALTRQQELRNINTELALTDAGFRTQMNQIGIGKPVPEPSWLSGGLGAVRGGVEGYRTGMEIKRMQS